MSKKGDIVWAKLKGYPWWPAIAIDPDDCGRDLVAENKTWLFWFGDHKVTEVEYERLLDFQKHFGEKTSIKIENSLKCAVQEALTVLADRYRIKYSDSSSLFEWANKGFRRNSRFSSDKSKLPDIVISALQSNKFKRKYVNCSEEDSEDEVVSVLNDVYKGYKSLEDICIVCCKSENSVVMPHPSFVGGVCRDCKKIIHKLCKFPKGKFNDFCVLCVQGGNLVYCSRSSCCRAYCEICIDYMAPKGSYSKILKDDNWSCYLCKPVQDVGCLIKRREVHSSKPVDTFPIPDEKSPIRVMGLTDAALPVLKKKKIAIGIYCTESSRFLESSSKPPLYFDFTEEEINEIQADFIYGSFFDEPSAANDRKKFAEISQGSCLSRMNNKRTDLQASIVHLVSLVSADVLLATVDNAVVMNCSVLHSSGFFLD